MSHSQQKPHKSEPKPTPKSALVVIDMQRALFEQAPNAVEAGFTVRRICALIDRARREDMQIVFTQQGSVSCPKGSSGWRLIDPLQPRFPDWVVARDQASLFHFTHLHAQLHAIGITRLILSGVSTEGLTTARREAEALGFEVVMSEDGQTHDRHGSGALNLVAAAFKPEDAMAL